MNTKNLAYVAVALCAWCGTLILTCHPAFGEKIYYPGVSFGEPGSGPGQFKEPVGVAVNDATGLEAGEGDVYVVDSGNDRVERFSSSGVYLGQFNGSGTYEVEGKEEHAAAAPSGAFQEPEQIAVDNCTNQLLGTTCTTAEDPSVGDVYVTDRGHKVVDKFSATGEYLGQLTDAQNCEERELPPCSRSKTIVVPFTNVSNVAVDPSGDVWVYGGESEEYAGAYVQEFSATGAALGWFRTTGGLLRAFAASSHETVYTGSNFLRVGEVAIFEKSPQEPTNDGFEEVRRFGGGVNSLTIAPSTSSFLAGDALTDMGNAIAVYAPITEGGQRPLETFPGETVPKGYEGLSGSDGLAVNASATVYASEHEADRIERFNYVSVPVVKTEPAPESGISETELTLHGSVNPEGEEVKECYFEYGTEAGKYTNSKGESNRIDCGSNEKNPGEGCGQSPSGKNEAVAVCAVLAGIEPAQVRSFRLVVEADSGIVTPASGLTVARPTTTDEAVSEVGSSSATASAQIDSGSLDTCYWVEYGMGTSYGSKTAKSCVGPGEKEKARVELSELRPDTVYHFRFEAANGLGVKAGEDRPFTTFPASGAGPPDGRVYEAVSSVGVGAETNVYVPAGMKGALDELARHGLFTNLPFQASADGDRVAYVGDPPATGGNGSDGVGGGNQYVAGHTSDGGWAQVSVDPSGYGNEYVALSGDLSVGVASSSEKLAEGTPVETGTGTAYHDLYGRSVGWRAAVGSLEPVLGSFEPLMTATPPCPVTEFGADHDNNVNHEPLFRGGNAGTAGVPAFGHIVFEANAALPSTPATVTPRGCSPAAKNENDLYDAVEGQLYLVNVLPNGKAHAGATIGRQGPSPNAYSEPEASNAVSADGSRIYWSAVELANVEGETEERPKALYVRENDTDPEGEHGECGEFLACTVQIDLSALPGTQTGKEEKGGYGKFWTATADGSRVFFTDERRLTSDSAAEPNEPDLYEYDLEAPEGERLSDLSVPTKPEVGAHADVQGLVGTSEDGSYVYFVAGGVLSEGANAEGRAPAPGGSNLYVRHGGVTRFIATLSNEDDDFTHGEGGIDGNWQADPGHRTAQVAVGGQSVVFMSRLPLTGYDNDLDEVRLTEVFVYDATTERLSCASCNPSGEPPVAPALPEFTENGNLSKIWGSFLPASDSLAGYQPRVISEDGDRVFFDSIEPLVPQDENGFLDVYEWERDGTGSCNEAPGCIFLLSGGQSDDNSYLIDASASGDDVFFVSRAQLSKADHGDVDVLYDARVGGVEPPVKVKCSGGGCQGQPSAPPLFATPASATFAGSGNPPSPPEVKKVTKKTVKCKKPRKLSHGRCVKRPKAKRAKRARRASRDRRASS
jgi:hypothetical protein